MDYKKKYLKYKAKYLNIKKQIKGFGDAGRTYGQMVQTGRAKRTQSGQLEYRVAASTIANSPRKYCKGHSITIASAPGAVPKKGHSSCWGGCWPERGRYRHRLDAYWLY